MTKKTNIEEIETVSEKDYIAGDPLLTKAVISESSLQDLIVYYVGNKHLEQGKEIENNNVTVSMIVEVFREEFPEMILAIAQENMLRGYAQALSDQREYSTTEDQELLGDEESRED